MSNVIRDTRKIWLVAHPLHQYKEDAKDLARRNNLRIIDVEHEADIDPEQIAEKTPKLTKLAEDKPAQASE
ncbi:hypothetical protein [Pseudomonas sp. GL-RE-29]|uniref:hypothetical protein n=1 Tax=Pseudomonas sp. GL-RE-29 TaxID=2832375 RepID=UPI001CC1056B|nr:hypothetical protein [Pseudomonas sp. GL-RE-29]